MANELERELAETPIPNLIRKAVRPEEGWEYSLLWPMRSRPKKEGEETWFGNRYKEWALPDIPRDIALGFAQLMEGPGRAGAYLRGEPGVTRTDVVPPNAMMAIAGTGMGAAATTMPKGALGTFGGRMAETANFEALEQAQRALQHTAAEQGFFEKLKNNAKGLVGMNKTPEQVWQKHGWTNEFADKQWRFEIDDSKSLLKQKPEEMYRQLRRVGAKAENVLDHPDLWKAYPELRNMRIATNPALRDSGAAATYNPANRSISINPDLLKESADEIRKTILHEIQHAVQHKEGFARGGSPEQFLRPMWHLEAALSGELEEALGKELAFMANAAAGKTRQYMNAEDFAEFIVHGEGKLAQVLPEIRGTVIEKFMKLPQAEEYIKNVRKNAILDEEYLKAIGSYKKLAGEQESWLTEDRMLVGAEGRRNSYPPKGFSVPAKEQTVIPSESWITLPNGQSAKILPVSHNPFK